MTTERISSSPRAMLWTSTVTLASRSAFCMTATMSTARTTPGIVPGPAEDVDAAEQDDRHDRQGHALARVGAGARQTRGQDDPASAAIRPDSTNRPILTRVTRTPEKRAALGVLADRVDLAPDPRPVEDDAEDDGEQRGRSRTARGSASRARARSRISVNAGGKSLTPRGPSTISARPRNRARVPEGDDERRQAGAGHEQRR